MNNAITRLLILGLLQQSVACSSTRSTTSVEATSSASSGGERTSLISPEILTRYNTPTIPAITAPPGNPHQQGGEGFVAPRGQRLEMPYDVLCLNAAAQAAVEANVEYRDSIAQNNCAAAIRTLGATAARDLSLIDAAASTREGVLDAQVRSSADALRLSNRTINDLRDQMSSNSRFATFMNFLIGLGGLAVGAGLAALILGLSN